MTLAIYDNLRTCSYDQELQRLFSFSIKFAKNVECHVEMILCTSLAPPCSHNFQKSNYLGFSLGLEFPFILRYFSKELWLQQIGNNHKKVAYVVCVYLACYF